MQPRYHINLFWYPDDRCWVADVPDLRPCSAHGDTPESAVAALGQVFELWLEAGRSTGQPIPEPRYSPGSMPRDRRKQTIPRHKNRLRH